MTKPPRETPLETQPETVHVAAPAPASGRLHVARLRHVFIEGLELIGSIGIYEHERRYEQRIVVTLALSVEDDYDGRSDTIGDVYDYDEALAAIRASVDQGHVNLLETLAERIADRCLANPRVAGVRVRIEKPDVDPSCRAVGIEIGRGRLG